MKVRFNRWYNAIFTALLTLLGYGCSSSEEYEDMVMYGVPTATYKVMGEVTDESGNPIEGIKTAAKIIHQYDKDDRIEAYGLDSIKTDSNGQYQLNFNGFPGDQTIKLVVEDVDGEANGGQFESDTLDVDYKNAVQTEKGSSFWNSGTFQIRQNISLKRK